MHRCCANFGIPLLGAGNGSLCNHRLIPSGLRVLHVHADDQQCTLRRQEKELDSPYSGPLRKIEAVEAIYASALFDDLAEGPASSASI